MKSTGDGCIDPPRGGFLPRRYLLQLTADKSFSETQRTFAGRAIEHSGEFCECFAVSGRHLTE